MPRLSLLDLDQASEPVREFAKNLPPLQIFQTIAHAESVFEPLMRVNTALNREVELSAKHIELSILHAANEEGGEYEWVQHVPTSAAAGVSELQLEALRKRDYSPEVWDATDRALLVHLQQVVEQSKVDPGVWNELRAHFSERQVVEILLIHGVYRTLAILTENAETPIDEPGSNKAFEAMERG